MALLRHMTDYSIVYTALITKYLQTYILAMTDYHQHVVKANLARNQSKVGKNQSHVATEPL